MALALSLSQKDNDDGNKDVYQSLELLLKQFFFHEQWKEFQLFDWSPCHNLIIPFLIWCKTPDDEYSLLSRWLIFISKCLCSKNCLETDEILCATEKALVILNDVKLMSESIIPELDADIKLNVIKNDLEILEDLQFKLGLGKVKVEDYRIQIENICDNLKASVISFIGEVIQHFPSVALIDLTAKHVAGESQQSSQISTKSLNITNYNNAVNNDILTLLCSQGCNVDNTHSGVDSKSTLGYILDEEEGDPRNNLENNRESDPVDGIRTKSKQRSNRNINNETNKLNHDQNLNKQRRKMNNNMEKEITKKGKQKNKNKEKISTDNNKNVEGSISSLLDFDVPSIKPFNRFKNKNFKRGDRKGNDEVNNNNNNKNNNSSMVHNNNNNNNVAIGVNNKDVEGVFQDVNQDKVVVYDVTFCDNNNNKLDPEIKNATKSSTPHKCTSSYNNKVVSSEQENTLRDKTSSPISKHPNDLFAKSQGPTKPHKNSNQSEPTTLSTLELVSLENSDSKATSDCLRPKIPSNEKSSHPSAPPSSSAQTRSMTLTQSQESSEYSTPAKPQTALTLLHHNKELISPPRRSPRKEKEHGHQSPMPCSFSDLPSQSVTPLKNPNSSSTPLKKDKTNHDLLSKKNELSSPKTTNPQTTANDTNENVLDTPNKVLQIDNCKQNVQGHEPKCRQKKNGNEPDDGDINKINSKQLYDKELETKQYKRKQHKEDDHQPNNKRSRSNKDNDDDGNSTDDDSEDSEDAKQPHSDASNGDDDATEDENNRQLNVVDKNKPTSSVPSSLKIKKFVKTTVNRRKRKLFTQSRLTPIGAKLINDAGDIYENNDKDVPKNKQPTTDKEINNTISKNSIKPVMKCLPTKKKKSVDYINDDTDSDDSDGKITTNFSKPTSSTSGQSDIKSASKRRKNNCLDSTDSLEEGSDNAQTESKNQNSKKDQTDESKHSTDDTEDCSKSLIHLRPNKLDKGAYDMSSIDSFDESFADSKNTNTKRRKPWSIEEELALLKGVSKFGVGRWVQIKDVCHLTRRSNVDIKDKWRNMVQTGRDKVLRGMMIKSHKM